MQQCGISITISVIQGFLPSSSVDVLMVEYFLSSPPLRLEATLSPLCAEPLSGYFVQALFGVRLIGSEDCVYLQSSTQNFSSSHTVFIRMDLTQKVSSTHTVFIGLDLTAISNDYEYCARAILNGKEKAIFDGRFTG